MDAAALRSGDLESRRICRFCLRSSSDQRPVVDVCGDRELAVRIATCLALEVSAGDGLPRTVCEACLWLTEKFYLFKDQCTRAEMLLKTFALTGLPLMQFLEPVDFGGFREKTSAGVDVGVQVEPVVKQEIKTSYSDDDDDDVIFVEDIKVEVEDEGWNLAEEAMDTEEYVSMDQYARELYGEEDREFIPSKSFYNVEDIFKRQLNIDGSVEIGVDELEQLIAQSRADELTSEINKPDAPNQDNVEKPSTTTFTEEDDAAFLNDVDSSYLEVMQPTSTTEHETFLAHPEQSNNEPVRPDSSTEGVLLDSSEGTRQLDLEEEEFLHSMAADLISDIEVESTQLTPVDSSYDTIQLVSDLTNNSEPELSIAVATATDEYSPSSNGDTELLTPLGTPRRSSQTSSTHKLDDETSQIRQQTQEDTVIDSDTIILEKSSRSPTKPDSPSASASLQNAVSPPKCSAPVFANSTENSIDLTTSSTTFPDILTIDQSSTSTAKPDSSPKASAVELPTATENSIDLTTAAVTFPDAMLQLMEDADLHDPEQFSFTQNCSQKDRKSEQQTSPAPSKFTQDEEDSLQSTLDLLYSGVQTTPMREVDGIDSRFADLEMGEIISDDELDPILLSSDSEQAQPDTPEKRNPAEEFPCQKCDKFFPQAHLLEAHQKAYHINSPQRPRPRSQRVVEKVPAKVPTPRKMAIVIDNPSQKCPKCGVMVHKASYWAHIKAHSPGDQQLVNYEKYGGGGL